jgi:CRISPR-associated endonuclease Csn1
MSRIFGVDLGTNSLGWSIREQDQEERKYYFETYLKSIGVDFDPYDEIVDFGVVIFKKGVGEGKSGEFSLAAERRTNRSKRRLYNAKRYRKWATLLELSKNGMCPISEEELRLWSIGNWQDGKNKGRVYPTSFDFIAWLTMDFDRIGQDLDVKVKLKPAYANPYELRADLLESRNDNDATRLYKIGRAFYHLVQRRGFKTSRKSGNTSYANNELFKKFKEEHPDKTDWKPSQIYLYLQSGKDPNPELRKERIRNNAVIQRGLNEDEFFTICKKQDINEVLANKIHKAIYYVRPLRTQKGLVGKCTLEKGKPRVPISHPVFEEFRALAFINNLQWRETNTKKVFEPIPISLKKQILEQLFFKRFEKGKNKGKVDESGTLDFNDIINAFSDKGKYEFNFRNKPTISTCPVIAGLMNVFDKEWKDKFIITGSEYGINWNGLALAYDVKYNGVVVKNKKLNYEEIWHLLFDYLQTKDDEEGLKDFCKSVLQWNDEKTTNFIGINISQGYGSLSRSAIDKIIPFLQQGFIYSEAVSFANLSKVLGKEVFEKNKVEITQTISDTITGIDAKKEKLNIVNSLIQAYFAEATTNRAKGFNGTIEEINVYKNEVIATLAKYFGESNWKEKSDELKQDYTDFILDRYLTFISGKQSKEEKASAGLHKNPEIDYYKLPRLDEAIKQTLQAKFNATETGLKKLYHPSDIDIYPKAKNNWLEDPNPPSKGWKNPMAMRTMYELRKLINYLLEIGKIDKETKIVVEMTRELNDANKRWAIQTYQRYREDENKEFAKAIIGVAKEKYPGINENDADNIDKVRLWWEQLENGEEVYKSIKALKEDVEKYRLWKEQGCQCLYTGKIIRLTDLFDGTSFDFEHTLPLSQSFDNSLANLTICDAEYNRSIKKNKIPTQLINYEKDVNQYQAIEPKIEKWIKKVETLKERIEKNKSETKKAIRSGNIEYKNELVKKRHLLQFDLDYWDKKVKTFTLTDLPNWWKNSQLVDTQIISKYARAYLKSLFNKVDVQKGSITAEFRNIYGIMGEEKKDRSKHSHHAKDAAVLTLIPGSAKREEILKKYYLAKENGRKHQDKPYKDFNISHILKIEETVLVNHISKDQTLSKAKKYVRKRGEIEFKKDNTGKFIRQENGKKIPLIMQGDGVRGQLHEQTYFGAIKETEKNENGYPIKESGQFKVRYEKDKEVIRYVIRKDIETLTITNNGGIKSIKENVVDVVLKKFIEQQLNNGATLDSLYSDIKKEKRIRHIRVYHNEKPIEIKQHSGTFLSKHKHKHFVYAMNGENYMYLLYKGLIEGKEYTEFELINLKTFVENKDLFNVPLAEIPSKEVYNNAGNFKGTIRCKAILKVGQKVLFYRENVEELKLLDYKELKNRMYKIRQLENDGRIKFDYHLEARKEDEIKKEVGDGKTKIDFEIPYPKLRLSKTNLDFALENVDFIVKADATIQWLNH